jgi:hypothetical protein
VLPLVAALSACSEGVAPPACELEARLLPGEVFATDPTSSEPGCGLLLPALTAGARYRVAVVRPDSAAPEATSSVILRVESVASGATPVTQSALAQVPDPFLSQWVPQPPTVETVAPGPLDRTGAFHRQLRTAEAALVRELGASGLLPSRERGLLARAPSAAPSPPKFSFDPQTSCQSPRSARTGVLVGENDVLAIYQDSVEQAGGGAIRADHLERMLTYFAVHGKPTVEQYFGRLPDVDGNGKVYAFVSAQPFTDPSVVAYVWAGNFYARSMCPASDEAEVIFLNPARIRSMTNGEWVALGVLSHESQHLVSLYHRLARTRRRSSNTFLSHPTWIEEGRAELADEITARRAWSTIGGPGVTQRVGWDQLRTLGYDGLRCCKPEAWTIALEASRTLWYLSTQPNGLAVVPAGAGSQADIRNGGWHFHRWLADSYGSAASAPGADAALFRSLTDSLTSSGEEGFQDVLDKSFQEVLEEFAAAVMLHGASPSPAVRTFTTYDFVSLTASLFQGNSQPPGRYPWPVTTSGSGSSAVLTRPLTTASYTGAIGPTGIRIHDFTSDGTGVGARLTVDTTVPVRLVVVRVQ